VIEFFIYTLDEEPIDIGKLKSTLHDVGWTTHVLRGWLGQAGAEIVKGGALQDDDSTIGYRNSELNSSLFQRAVTDADLPQLREWVNDSRMGYAMWMSRPFTFAEHSEFESLDDAREQMGDEYADCLSRAKRQYIVTNCIDPEFGAAAMGAVAFLAKGIVEDPQLGISISAPSNVSVVADFLSQWPT
jgi:hypothetical protein